MQLILLLIEVVILGNLFLIEVGTIATWHWNAIIHKNKVH